jgi:hypothetical protein
MTTTSQDYHNPYRQYPSTTTEKILGKFRKRMVYRGKGGYRIQTLRKGYIPEMDLPDEGRVDDLASGYVFAFFSVAIE